MEHERESSSYAEVEVSAGIDSFKNRRSQDGVLTFVEEWGGQLFPCDEVGAGVEVELLGHILNKLLA